MQLIGFTYLYNNQNKKEAIMYKYKCTDVIMKL